MLLIKDKDNLLMQFMPLKRLPGIAHAVVCRSGGVSRPPYDGLNLSAGVGDDPAAVAANRRRLLQLTGGGRHVYARQNHGIAIRVVDRDAASQGRPIQTVSRAADALITRVAGVHLLIQTADCQAVMIVDPLKRVVANVHCGWRGSVANIIGRTVDRMTTAFGCDPGGMVAAIGPSLGPCCAEFLNYRQEIPRRFWGYRTGRHHFDFWRISRGQLIDAGLAADDIHASRICTRCNPHLFFSYRTARRTGRFAAAIGMTATSEDASS